MALVIDEFGTSVGIVTLENVLEEIVGPVRDEFDVELPDVVPEGPGSYLVRGGAAIDRVAKAIGAALDLEEVDTAAGLIMVKLGRLPQQGDRVEHEGFMLEVLEIQKNRATLIRFSKNQTTVD
jgi:CBS domain containing-hemolysin-like protein